MNEFYTAGERTEHFSSVKGI